MAPARDQPAKLSCTTAEPGALRGQDPRKRRASEEPRQLARASGVRPGALRDGPHVAGPGQRRASDRHPAPHLQPTQTTRYEAIGAGETQISKKHSSAAASTQDRSRGCGFLVLTVRSDEPHEERAAMSWYSRPRQCGEVALTEQAMIRGLEPYHPRGRLVRHKCPVNADRSRAPGSRAGDPAREAAGAATPAFTLVAALATMEEEGPDPGSSRRL